MQTLPMTLETDAVGANGALDARYTCDLDNSSPELKWNHVPKGTSSFALIARDLELSSNGTVLWVVYRIPQHIHHLPAGIPPQEALPNGIFQGVNSFGKLGYFGPCPPIGDRKHHYQFRLFALSAHLELGRRLTEPQLSMMISSYVIATAEIVGVYQRMIQKAG